MRLIKQEELKENGVIFIVETYTNGERETVVKTQKSTQQESFNEPEPTQLDRIEDMLFKSHEEIKNEAIDEYTSMLMEEGVF